MDGRSYLMIRPCRFGYNPQTAVNNAFQKNGPQEKVQEKALAEFDAYVKLLRNNNINVLVVEDTPEPHTPDSIFPNNWISFHPNEMAILYPMFAPNRRLERKKTVFQAIQQFTPRRRWIDMSLRERQDLFLEGTGSLIFDRENAKVYACRSPRTNATLFQEICETLQYKGLLFDAVQGEEDSPIYHTNVMMCMADKYVVICMDTVKNPKEKEMLENCFKEDKKEVIRITTEQMNHFAGNMFQVFSVEGNPFLVMSRQAYDSLSATQREKLMSFNPLIVPQLETIEVNGGGGARCMLAEIV